jgi:energy-coupling factor transport system permease protein
MNRGLFHRRLPSPLHAARAGIGALWAIALSTAALLLYHPLALATLALALLGAGFGAGVGRETARALRTALVVALPIVFVNVLVARQGLTVFARLGDLGPFGQGDLTIEALVYGAVIGLKVTVLILVSTLASLAIDPDELLRLLRPLSFRSALTASLATRMLPVLAADAQRLGEAQRTRPEGSPARGAQGAVARGGRGGIGGRGGHGGRSARGRVALLSAVLGGSLDRAMDVAATLELRGFAVAKRPTGRLPGPWSRHDLAFAASAVAVAGLALAGRLTGAASFAAYPELHVQLDLATLALCTALLLAVLLPLGDRRGIQP